MNRSLFPLLALLGLGLGLSGCNVIPAPQSDPTRYYVLTGPSAGGAEPASPAQEAGRLRIGLKAVDVASYLRGPEVVVRVGENEIRLDEYARWAETLQAGIARVLREELAADPAVAKVDVPPFPLDAQRDYDVAVTVLHCEGSTGGPTGRTARFEAVVRISTAGSPERLVLRRVFSAPAQSWDGRDYNALAGLLSTDVAELGRQIISELPQSAPAP